MANDLNKVDSVEAVETTETKVEPKVNQEPSDQASKKEQNIVAKYLLGIWYNFIDSFRYNHCKLPGILIALPGLFIGFFLIFHSRITFLGGIAQFSGFYMFMLVLFGCINIFNGVTVISKKNLSSIIISIICSLVIVVFGILWIYSIFYSYNLATSGKVELLQKYTLGVNEITSMICVILSMICSTVGCVLAFIFRDKNYKKVKF